MQPLFTKLSGISYARERSSPTVNVIMVDDQWLSHIQEVVIGAYRPPLRTTVLWPSDGATISGRQLLGAMASGAVSNVQFELTGSALSHSVIVIATRTEYGWLAHWMTTRVPNGTYTLRSVASGPGGDHDTSPAITIRIAN
jgi:hypothetical protein